MKTIPTMTRVSLEVRKRIEDIANDKKWTVAFTVSQLLEEHFAMYDKNREIA